MSIITIAHGAYSGGNAIADLVAKTLGYQSIDREVLIEASKRYGIPEAKYVEVLEAESRWWERWRESLRLYRITLQAAMCEVAQGGQLVYHGRAGQQLLPGIGHVLRVLIVAPIEYRIEFSDAALLFAAYISQPEVAKTAASRALGTPRAVLGVSPAEDRPIELRN